jgi:hypothetical protein
MPKTLLVRSTLLLLVFAAVPSGAAPTDAPANLPKPQRDLARRTYDVVLKGHVAYLATTAGLVAVEIKDPAKPRYISALPLPGSVNALAWVDGKLAVALGPVGLAVVDASKPEQLKVLGGLRINGAAMGIAAVGKLALVASGTAGLHVVDLSDPASPVKVAHWETEGYARAVRVSGDLAFLADGLRGVHIFRMNGKQGTYLSTYRSRGHVHGLFAAAKRMVVAEGTSGVSVVDITDPKKPTMLGRSGILDTARGVDVVKTFALVADGTKGIVSLDLSDPKAPRQADRFRPKRSVNALTAVGDTVYVANDYDGLLILKLDAAGKLTLAGTLPADTQKPSK